MSQRPRPGFREFEVELEAASRKIDTLHRMLESRKTDLTFDMTEDQWRLHTETFGPVHNQFEEREDAGLVSVVKRSGTMGFRIAMSLSVLRAYERGDRLDQLEVLHATDDDVDIAFSVATTLVDHGLRLAKQPPTRSVRAGRRADPFYEALPEAFRTRDAIGIGVQYDLAERTVGDRLSKYTDEGLLKNPKKGSYEKV